MTPESSLAPLRRVVQKYRSDVHQLLSGAPEDALDALERHLGSPLPADLRAFLREHNGASLFRGSLRIRPVAEITTAREDLPEIVLFGDVESPAAYARTTRGDVVFGAFIDGAMVPLHGSLHGWLAAAVDELDLRATSEAERELLAFSADHRDSWQMVRAAEAALRAGRPDEAVPLLQRALDQKPDHVGAWSLLGDALVGSDRAGARMAWREALRRTRLPLAWPGAPCPDPEILVPLSHAFADPVAWERELERFLDDRVTDVRTEAGAELARAVVRTLAASLLRRGRRRAARDMLARWVERERGFAWSEPAWSLWLDLSELQIELGEHDDAELALRRCATDGPAELRGAALLRIARIATARHEPWAEELLDEALAAGVGNEDRLELALVGCERAVRVEHPDVARRWLDRAESVAKASGRRATAALLLARGEVLRLEGKEEEGVDAWMDALDASPGPDVRGRIHLRLGDRALRSGRRADAELHYNEALLAFEESDLPLREAWARLRFAAAGLDAEEHLKVARERFVAADLAAGVVAVDLARGAPEEGLAWHLERATAHARARHDAQRCRPPWTRADAERPERRLGAHRVALAACGGDVVRALGVEMEACVRAMRAGRSRSADPPVLRYIAAADLLSAHRSYDAARVLLDHLLARVTDGPAQRALQGAIARSPNVALTDALLDVLERAAAHPAQAVAEAAEVVGLRREKAALPSLVKLAAPGAHPVVRRAAIVALGRVGDPDTADVIDGALPDPGLSEPAAVALLLLGDRRGVDFHGRALAGDRRDLTGSPGEIVGRFGGPGYLLLLRNVALGSDAGALGALQGLGLLGDPRAVPVLLEALTGRSRPIAEVAAGALQILTGHSEDLDEPGGRTRFAQWWEANQARYRDGLRYRDGRVFDVGALLSRMDDDDSWTRRSAYDELVIATGCRLPFDADGPWRVQRSHVVAWRAWWHEHRAAFPAGGWYLDGERIG